MPAVPVEAVWIWKYVRSNFAAAYGRRGKAPYTHDFLQSGGLSSQCGGLLSRVFGVEAVADASRNIEFRWPRGSHPGFVSFSNDRYHVGWATNDAPLPWKVSPNPSAATAETIPGDPTKATYAEAEAEWATLSSQDLDPYLIAVKLRDEDDVLHIRAYLGKPNANLQWASLDQTPDVIQELASSTRRNDACRALEVTGGVTAEPDVAALIGELAENPNVLLVGPPGTGKTVLLEKLAHFVEHNAGGLLFDPDLNHDAFSTDDSGVEGMARTVVLHPAYTYENLVVGLLPEPVKGGIAVKPTPGPLVNLAQYASQPGRRALLVLDEFNRGNAAAVLGDTIALLDRDKRGKSTVDLPYSELGIKVPTQYANGKSVDVPAPFTLPENLWIVAAMNSSDRSVAPLDAALRRRFSIREMPPNYDVLAQRLGADEDPDFTSPFDQWTSATVGALAVRLLRAINDRIDTVLGPDFRLGQSNFWNVGGDTPEVAIESLTKAFDHRIVATLRLAMQDDDGALAAVLRAGTAESPATRSNAVAFWRKGDDELGTYASARLHIRELSGLTPDQTAAELRHQAKV